MTATRARLLRRLSLLAALVALAFALRHAPLGEDLERARRVLAGESGEELPRWSLVTFAALNAGLVALGFPRLVFHAIAGALFGFAVGLGVSLGASVLGSVALVAFARWAQPWRAAGAEEPRSAARLFDALDRRPLLAVFLARQAPLSGLLVNLVLGWSRVPARHVVVGTALGYLPSAAAAAFAGQGLRSASIWISLACVGPAVLALPALAASGRLLWRRLARGAEVRSAPVAMA
jgi:uncharacterized membrane protein YdjX (TVP38/TMEM64 family)